MSDELDILTLFQRRVIERKPLPSGEEEVTMECGHVAIRRWFTTPKPEIIHCGFCHYTWIKAQEQKTA